MDLSITAQERSYLANQDLDKFWYSRQQKKDPIARIGYALWCKSADDLKRAINTGDQAYWDRKGFAYWETMARTTVVNLSVGLQKAGFNGTFGEMREEIKKIGLAVANAHAEYVKNDIRNNYGRQPGLLSMAQIADYHHEAFAEFYMTPDIYGGTFLSRVPDEWEFKLYGDLYCHDCDSSEGYLREQVN
ncbi:hypothetical protein ACPUEK_00985 [Marinomonas gallaica]|uniref:hypothetical protein n=1 Tax=Marinomonas gallaica TaxID=1806667 RepID=UPI003CE4BC95